MNPLSDEGLGLDWLLTSIGSWTNARWDQHLRDRFGDVRTDEIIAALGYEKRPAGEAPRPKAETSSEDGSIRRDEDESPICLWYDDSDESLNEDDHPTCRKPATHYSCNEPGDGLNACVEHKCRCKQPEEVVSEEVSEEVPPMNRCSYVIHDRQGGDRRCTRLSCHSGVCAYEPEAPLEWTPIGMTLVEMGEMHGMSDELPFPGLMLRCSEAECRDAAPLLMKKVVLLSADDPRIARPYPPEPLMCVLCGMHHAPGHRECLSGDGGSSSPLATADPEFLARLRKAAKEVKRMLPIDGPEVSGGVDVEPEDTPYAIGNQVRVNEGSLWDCIKVGSLTVTLLHPVTGEQRSFEQTDPQIRRVTSAKHERCEHCGEGHLAGCPKHPDVRRVDSSEASTGIHGPNDCQSATCPVQPFGVRGTRWLDTSRHGVEADPASWGLPAPRSGEVQPYCQAHGDYWKGHRSCPSCKASQARPNVDDVLRQTDGMPLVDALTHVATWENERAVAQALRGVRDPVTGALWDTCFLYVFRELLLRREKARVPARNEVCGSCLVCEHDGCRGKGCHCDCAIARGYESTEVEKLRTELAWLYSVTAVKNIAPEEREAVDAILTAERERLIEFRTRMHKAEAEIKRRDHAAGSRRCTRGGMDSRGDVYRCTLDLGHDGECNERPV